MTASQKTSTDTLVNRWRAYLSAPIDGASLGIFRICLGLAVAYSLLRFLPSGDPKFADLFVETEWNFPYPGFEWAAALSPDLLRIVFGVSGVAALFFAAGIFYRGSAVLMFLGYTYYFLVEAARFNNHYYLISLLTFLVIWMPCDRRFALRLPRSRKDGALSPLIPRWPVFLLRAQLFIVYFYGGVAKVNADWITGEPIIGSAQVFAELLGSTFPFLEGVEAIVYAKGMAWIGLVFDFAIGFLLLIPRTRLLSLGLLACFHGINELTLPIGVFPFLAFTASFIFLEPDWPLRVWRWLRKPRWIAPDWRWFGWGAVVLPGVGALLGWKLPQAEKVAANAFPSRMGSPLLLFVSAFLFLQMTIPLRHFFIAGDPSWTEEGQFFSWRMMLRQKSAGNLTLHLYDPEVYVAGSEERRIDWKSLPGVSERALYIPIDAFRFQWDGNKGLNTLYEGIFGYRLVQAVKGTTPEEVERERAQLEEWWEAKTGEPLAIVESRPLAECLDRTRQRLLQIEAEDGEDSVTEPLKFLREARRQVDGLELLTLRERGKYIAGVHDYLFGVLDSEYRDEIMAELKAVHPLAVLGVDPPGNQRFWILAQCDGAAELQALSDRLGRGEDYLVWCDFGRLRFYEWEGLPRWFPVFESGRLALMWNYFEQLNLRQKRQIAVRPYMMRQFAKRIAREWEERFGRRPRVHGYGTVMMNYRHPVPIIDPTVDLASVDYSFWRHNEWILPQESERIGISERLRKPKPVHSDRDGAAAGEGR